jgi:hypothetical protein
MIRADQAKQRAALLERQVDAFLQAMDQFTTLYRREPDFSSPDDCRLIAPLLARKGAADVSRETLAAAAEALKQAEERAHEAATAMKAVGAAWSGRGGRTVREWVGVDSAAFDRAMEEALASSD